MNDITLTPSQQRVFTDIIKFIENDDDRVFILSGYAGTGKTTVVRFLIEKLEEKGACYQLLASTGRAAKILSDITGGDARTIHSLIYKCQGFNEDPEENGVGIESSGQLFLIFRAAQVMDNEDRVIYIIDESSMISDTQTEDITQAMFGDGRLLNDLLGYDRRRGSKYIFVGDPCQLPPVHEEESPALNHNYIRQTYGIGVKTAALTQIMRQSDSNSIISASMRIRQFWNSAPSSKDTYGLNVVWGSLPFQNSSNIVKHDSAETMLRTYISTIKEYGYSKATYITYSNRKCGELARVIRASLGKSDTTVQEGDLLLVVQNNLLTGVRNGDMVTVKEIGANCIIKAGMTFRDITYQEVDSGRVHTQLFIEDILYENAINLNKYQQTALFRDFIMRMKQKGIKHRTEAFDYAMRQDPFLNALRCCFGYAVTCHKAQGGEWPEVFVDISRWIMRNPDKATYQWIYTAMTRAQVKLHLVNDFYIR